MHPLSELQRKLKPLLNVSAADESETSPEVHKGYCFQPVTGLKLRALNSAGIRARSSP